MGTIEKYIADDDLKEIKRKALESSKEYTKQTAATKLELADKIKFDQEFQKEVTKYCFGTIVEQHKEIKFNERTIDAYKTKYGEINKNYVENFKEADILAEDEELLKEALQKRHKKLKELQRQPGNQQGK